MSSSLGNGASFGQTNFPKGEKTTQSIWLHQGEGTWCSAESPLLLRLVVVGSFLTQFTGDFLLWQISAGVIGCKSSTCTSADIDLLKIIMSFNKESRIWQLWGIVWLQQSERSPRCSRMACGVLLVSLHSRFGPLSCWVWAAMGTAVQPWKELLEMGRSLFLQETVNLNDWQHQDSAHFIACLTVCNKPVCLSFEKGYGKILHFQIQLVSSKHESSLYSLVLPAKGNSLSCFPQELWLRRSIWDPRVHDTSQGSSITSTATTRHGGSHRSRHSRARNKASAALGRHR